jgi:hypothetical protein
LQATSGLTASLSSTRFAAYTFCFKARSSWLEEDKGYGEGKVQREEINATISFYIHNNNHSIAQSVDYSWGLPSKTKIQSRPDSREMQQGASIA